MLCVSLANNHFVSRSVKMNSQKFTKVCWILLLVTFCTLFSPTFQETLQLSDENLVEIHDEPKYYCNLELKSAIRKFCRDKVIKTYRDQQLDRNLQKSTRKCGQELQTACCLSKCTINTFVNFCPYRYHRR